MFRRLEALGERMLGLVLPRVTAAAGCPPDPYCRSCGASCRFQRCALNSACNEYCGSCSLSCSANSVSGTMSLC